MTHDASIIPIILLVGAKWRAMCASSPEVSELSGYPPSGWAVWWDVWARVGSGTGSQYPQGYRVRVLLRSADEEGVVGSEWEVDGVRASGERVKDNDESSRVERVCAVWRQGGRIHPRDLAARVTLSGPSSCLARLAVDFLLAGVINALPNLEQ